MTDRQRTIVLLALAGCIDLARQSAARNGGFETSAEREHIEELDAARHALYYELWPPTLNNAKPQLKGAN